MSFARTPVKARSLGARFSLSVISAQLVLGSVASMLPAGIPLALATATVETATGGDKIDSSTVGGAYTNLTKPKIKEGATGDIGVGTIILNAPSGFEFDTGGTAPTVKLMSGDPTASCNINDASNNTLMAITSISTSQITFTVTAASECGPGNKNDLEWHDVRVRPTSASLPFASGNLTVSGTSTIAGVTGSTNFGTLTEVGRSVLKEVSSYSGAADSDVTYDITITNGDVADATSVSVTDILPANTTFVSGSRSGGTEGGGATVTCSEAAGTVTCPVGGDGKLKKNKTIIISLVLHVSSSAPCGTISNTARYLSSNGIDITSSAADISVSSGCSSTATLTVNATVINDNGGSATAGTFSYFIDATGVSDGVANSGLATGAHTVSVTGTSGYDVTIGGDCASDGSITLAASDNKACSVTLDDIGPKITVTKSVTNDNGGAKVVGDFTLKVDSTNVTSGVQNTFSAGNHTISDAADSQYQGTIGGDCSSTGSLTTQLGGVYSCTITNDDIAPKLTVTKVVTNDNGGTKVVADFTLKVDGSSVTSGAQNAFSAGNHTVSEDADSGYTGTISGDCASDGSITMVPGGVYSCTITNDDIAPKITVTKTVTNDNGGTKVVSDFTLKVDSTTVTSGVQNTFNAGNHTISEVADSQYEGTIGGDCASDGSITMAPGGVYSCTISNDDIAPTLTVTKVVVNDNGGTKIVSDFPLFIDATSVTSGAANTVTAGVTYTVSETSDPQYAEDVIAGDCASDGTITLLPGENKTCIITNDDKPAHLHVIKEVVNDNGGTKVESDFTINVSAVSPDQTSFTGEASPGTDVTMNAGSFDITETADSGYAATYSADCSGTMLPGDDKTCTITNDDIQPKLTVTKVVINDNGGTLVVADFPLYVDGGSVTSGDENGFDAGTYTVSEDGQPSTYAATFSGDCNGSGTIVLDIGEVKQCTITNDDIAPTLTIIKQVDNSNGDDKQPDDFTLTVDGVTVSNGIPVALNVGVHTAGEVETLDYHGSISGDCGASNGTLLLNLGEKKTCTITNHDRPNNSTAVNNRFAASSNSQTNGGGGSQTNLLAHIADFVAGNNGGNAPGSFGGLPPGSFGGGPFDPWSTAEKDFLCSMQKKAPFDNPGLLEWFAEYIAAIISRDSASVKAVLEDDSFCAPQQEAKVETAPTVVRLDRLGRVVSNNPVWNACVRGGKIPLGLIQHNFDKVVDRDYSRPKTCRDYNTGSDTSVWKMPGEFGIEVTLDKKGRLIGELPTGYVAVKDAPKSNVASK